MRRVVARRTQERCDPGLEAEIEAKWSERRLVADAESDRASQVGKIHLARPEKHVARVDEANDTELVREAAGQHRHPELAVEDDRRVAANREAFRVDRVDRRVVRLVADTERIEREPAVRVAAGKKPLGLRNRLLRLELGCQADARVAREDQAAGPGKAMKRLRGDRIAVACRTSRLTPRSRHGVWSSRSD